MKKNLNLVEDPLLPTLIKFTFPILCSILLQVTYGTVDLLVVGKFSTTGDLSGVTIGGQVMQTVTNFCSGIAMGTTILLGQFIGSKQTEKTSRVVGSSVVLFGLLAAVITGLMLLFVDEIGSLMNTPTAALAQMRIYLQITGSGAVFIVFYNLLGSIFRGIGDSKTPLMAVAIACVVNIVLDLIFVAVMNLGAMGAALATVVAQGISVLISLIFLSKKELPFEFGRKTLTAEYFSKIFILGLPVALQSALVGISFLVITSIINVFGEATSAGVGVVEKITGLIMVVPIAFMQSLSAFTAQNYGAGNMKRGKLALLYGIGISLGFGVVMAYIAAFHGQLLTQFFIDDPETTQAALEYLRSYAIDTVLVCFIFCFTGFFNGCGKTKFVMAQAVFGACCIRIPLAYYFSSLEETSLFIIGLATPASTLVQIVLFGLYYYKLNRKQAKIS